jgi:MOSC domain-containing protein
VRIELADGNSVLSDAADVDAVLSRFFGRDVELARAAHNGYTIDQYHPDLENYDPEGHRDEVVEAQLGAAFFNERGLPSAVPEDSFFDLYPLSVLTTSTLDQLGNLEPQSRFDVRRFRMNVIVDTPERGFVENGWLGRTLAIGDDLQLGVSLPDPRCCMPGLPQEDLPRDPQVLKALARHNRIRRRGGALPLRRGLRRRGGDGHSPQGRQRQPRLSAPTTASSAAWPSWFAWATVLCAGPLLRSRGSEHLRDHRVPHARCGQAAAARRGAEPDVGRAVASRLGPVGVRA